MNGGEVSKLDAPMCGLNFEENRSGHSFLLFEMYGTAPAPTSSALDRTMSARSPRSQPRRAREQLGVETVGLGAPMLARHGYARCVDNVGLDAACLDRWMSDRIAVARRRN
jgi:hypothetical protein